MDGKAVGIWFFAAVVWICSALFFGIGVYALRIKHPMHFWSGSTVFPSEIRDIKGYNRANSIMWLVYGAGMALIGFLGFVSVGLSGILAAVYVIGSLPVLILLYRKIYDKYRA